MAMMLDDVRQLQGHHVGVALADHSRIDDAVLSGVVADESLWLHSDGTDVFVPLGEILDLWELPPPTPVRL